MDTVFDQYTWQQFDEDCEKIAAWARNKDFKTLYGIPRGGLIVAVRLSHVLDIPIVLNKDDITRQTLIVDDIVDTGNTMKYLLSLLGDDAHIASLYVSADAAVQPQFSARRKESWVIFPWETTGTSRYDHTAME